jgi:hypothetical protein
MSSLASVGKVGGRLAWRPESGAGAKRLRVELMSNHKSVNIAFERLSKYLDRIPRATFAPISRNALELAKRYSSGTFSRNAQEAFRRLHGYGPYSLRRPPQHDDYIINKQTGRMLRGWRRRGTSGTGTTKMEMAIYNVARSDRGFNYPLALFTGTTKMRERPLPQKIYGEISAELDREINKWRMRIRRGWSGSGRVSKDG